MSPAGKVPTGAKVIVVIHLFSFGLWLVGQTGAVVAYDRVAALGLQGPREMLDPVVVEVNRAIGLADTIVMLPLFLFAAVGILRKRFYGAVGSWLVFGMTLYWPVVFFCSQGFYAAMGVRHQPTSPTVVLLPAALMALALWGSWWLGRNRRLFT